MGRTRKQTQLSGSGLNERVKRVKRKIHTANLSVNWRTGEVEGQMVEHLRKNQRLAMLIELSKSLNGRRVLLNARDAAFRLKNNVAVIKNGRAVFDDIRFLDSTERKAKMDLVIQVAETELGRGDGSEFIIRRAIKITADGPRNRGMLFLLYFIDSHLLISFFFLIKNLVGLF